jgi:caffeoyl-CoA O-methyltransferase
MKPAARRLPSLTRELHGYLAAHSMKQDEILAGLSAETAQRFPFAAGMQIGPEQGAFLTLLTRFIGVRRAIEVGTFTGYSSICIARGLATGGN